LGECLQALIEVEPMQTDYRERITIEPGKRGGKPCIRNMRITVYDVLDWLAQGMSERDITTDHPELEVEDIRACLAFAANREHQLTAIHNG
jgi:uncharacterized protein (DUF433 family)